MALSQNLIPPVLKIKKRDEIKKILISETTGPIGTKLCLVLC
jgi:hypothetical protein